MSDVLSQSEIDALLAAMAAGESIDEVSEQPSKEEESTQSVLLDEGARFSERDLQVFDYVHNKYAEVLAFSMFRDIQVRVSLESVQEIRYEEFRHSIASPSVITVFKLNPLEGYLLFETNPEFASKVYNLCSNPDGDRKQDLHGDFESDKDIYRKITEKFIKQLEQSWSDVLTVTSEVEYVETDPANIKELFANEAVVLVSLSVTFNEVTNLFNICIPYSSIEKYSGNLEIRPVFPQVETSSFLENAKVNIKAVLTDMNLSLGELMELKKGMILNTHKPYENKVTVLIEGKHCFDGEAGILQNRKAIKIKNCLDKDVQR